MRPSRAAPAPHLALLLLLLATGLAGCAPPGPSDPPAYAGYAHEVLLPAGYAERAQERFPLILFLHGAGGLIPADHVIPRFAADRPGFPFVVVAPRTAESWQVERLDALLREVQDRYRIDETRVYVTGLSMGAFGAWNLAAAYPGRFAALALVAGGGQTGHACSLRHLPVWLFHNQTDPVTPAQGSMSLADALRRCGAAEVRLTLYEALEPGLWEHNAWKAAYHDPELYAWLLRHRS
jgi:predicted peptidase